MKSSIRWLHTIGAIATVCMFSFSSSIYAQAPEPEEDRISTADGLKLFCKWYDSGKGKNSPVVLMVHNYGQAYHSGAGDWDALAKALQKEGNCVLTFDMRGHGKSGDAKTIFDAKDFVKQPYNKFSGAGANPNTLKQLTVKNFGAGYYPYLINDIAAARRFIDIKNDAGNCNAGRICVVADREIGPLVMYWMAIEFHRNAANPNIKGAEAPKVIGGEDIIGAVFLSFAGRQGFTPPMSAVYNYNKNKYEVFPFMRDKLPILFFDAKAEKDLGLQSGPKYWFGVWGIDPAKKNAGQDKSKYAFTVSGADKLRGIDLLKAKCADDEKIDVNIAEFVKKKASGGNTYQTRNPATYDLIPVPLHNFGIK